MLGKVWMVLPLVLVSSCSPNSKVVAKTPSIPSLNNDAVWPWKGINQKSLDKGVRHWKHTGQDGASLDLVEFDFVENPELKFAIYDQDQDDETPFDNKVDYFPHGVGQVVHHLEQSQEVMAAWNGLFFAYDRGPGSPQHGWARHIGPVVLEGKPYFNVGRHRWMFGVKDGTFKATFKPDKGILAKEFDYAADGAQLLIKDGHPLRIQPYEDSIKNIRPVDTQDDVGALPIADWMKTSRASLAWSKDSRYLWALFIIESDHETASKLAAKYGKEDRSGWTLRDLQTFWLAKRAWAAINLDGGVVTQFALKGRNGFELQPAQQATDSKRRVQKDLKASPSGGSLQTFYIWQER